MSFSNLGKLFQTNKNRIAFIYDLDFSPNGDVDFNVLRIKILDQKLILRQKLRNAILTELKNCPEYEYFEPKTKQLFENNIQRDAFDSDLNQLKKRLYNADRHKIIEVDEDMMGKILKILPKENWPVSVHRFIAEELNISRSQAYAAIATLIITGKIKNPNHKE